MMVETKPYKLKLAIKIIWIVSALVALSLCIYDIWWIVEATK